MVSEMDSPKRKGRTSASEKAWRMLSLRFVVSLSANVSACPMTGTRLVRSARRLRITISAVEGVSELLLA